ncbi:helix-turn-helix domain-containing protein, partial [Pseudomonas sp. EA_5y_Pfl2_R50]
MMTAEQLRAARTALGLSAKGLARLVDVQSGRTVRKWEAGDRDVPGPVAVLLRALMESRSVRRYFGVVVEADS